MKSTVTVVHEHARLDSTHSFVLYDLCTVHTLYRHTRKNTIPVRKPVICLSKLLNCCLYLSLEACGTAQSLGAAAIGDITDVEEEAELKDRKDQT